MGGALTRSALTLLAASLLPSSMASFSAHAAELQTLYRSARIQAMGGTFVSTAEGEDALFLNPAGLADMGRGAQANLIVSDTTVSTDALGELKTGAEIFKDLNAGSLNKLLGKNYTLRQQIRSTIIGPSFGFGYILDGQYSFVGKNRSLPKIVLGHQTTSGLQAGFGFKLGRGSEKRRAFQLKLGGALKYLTRRGGYRDIPVASFTRLSSTELSSIVGDHGSGIGFDLGSQAVLKLQDGFRLQAGLSWLDITDTGLGESPDPIIQNLSTGVSGIFETERMRFTLSYEVQHLLESADWRKKNHLGFEASFPVFNVFLGLNQFHLGYGVGFNFWLIRVDLANYAETVGVLNDMDVERRWNLKASLQFGF